MAKVMVVDDAAFMRDMLRIMLTAEGHEIVAEASNGIEAVSAYLTSQPDLVTMDITMPDMNGVEALKEIFKHDSNAKIIMCSAMSKKEIVVDAISSGAKDFIFKPFQRERLVESVKKVLSL